MEIIYDVLLLYNEREPYIDEIVNELDASGYATFFWRRDVLGGTPVEVEVGLFDKTATILIFLGEHGWGVNHLRIAKEANLLQKRIIPILIGKPPVEGLNELNQLFITHRYANLQTRDENSYQQLLEFIGPPQVYITTDRFDRIIGTLTDGDNESRLEVLKQIRATKSINRAALSIRLREEINNRFKIRNSFEIHDSPRNPEQTSTIRSWMCSALIENDPDDIKNKELLLNHIRQDFEIVEIIRYWILSGLYRKNVSYINEAIDITISDSSELIRNLALAINAPDDQTVVKQFKEDLKSDQPDKILTLLRVLRVVPVPSLTEEICTFILTRDLKNLTYDAYYALANPEMASSISNYLTLEKWKEFIKRMLILLRSSEPNAIWNFSNLLYFSDQLLINELLDSFNNDKELGNTARIILSTLKDLNQNVSSRRLFISGYNADTINVKEDWLDISQDVKTLTAIMLAKEVSPPLAIGLFGNWGSGKSFFMESLHSEIVTMQGLHQGNPNSLFCTRIVQVRFNAWHYVDTSLWASLVDVIFEKLNNHVTPPLTFKQLAEKLTADLETVQIRSDFIQLAKRDMVEEIKEKKIKQKELKDLRVNKIISFKELNYEDITGLLLDDQKAMLSKALEDLGIPGAINSVTELKSVFSEALTVQGRINSTVFSILNSRNKKVTLGLILLIIVVLPLLGWVVNRYFDWDKYLTIISVFVAELSGLITGLALLVKNGLNKVKATLNIVASLKGKIDEKLKAKRAEKSPEELLLGVEIQHLEEELKKTETTIQGIENEIGKIEKEKLALEEQYSLNRFLSDRNRSDDYRKHLGLISKIRKDFDELADLMVRVPKSNVNVKPVDRIILYIDDLDRCPTEKVMEVLQAVHLMLAYKLFVVVVGVDPRWLLSSLNHNFSAFHQSLRNLEKDDFNSLNATPQDFLEKIFQIPFYLRQMSNEGFEKLLDHLFVSKLFMQEDPLENIESNIEEERKMLLEKTESVPTPQTDSHEITPTAHSLTTTSVQLFPEGNLDSRQASDKFTISEESLSIKPWETEFAKKLYAFIQTPRSAKRFTNIYRIIKAYVKKEDLPLFEGSKEVAGYFQIPMILLAIQLGNQENASYLFIEIYKQSMQGKGLKAIFLQIQQKNSVLASLAKKVLALEDIDLVPKHSQPIRDWLPLVSRFSFEPIKILENENNE